MRNKTLIVALEYLEPEWQQTKKCIEHTGLDVAVVSRDGVGNMARAFNSIRHRQDVEQYDYLWFVTNITFPQSVPFHLIEAMNKTDFAAIHPAMKSSDHRHQWPDRSGEVKDVPFVEWTAPMVRTGVFLNTLLDEMCPYYYFDLIWSYEVRQKLHRVAVHHGVEIDHTYLRNNQKPHLISEIRKRLRDYWTPISKEYCEARYGPDWRQVLNWK